MLTVFSSPSRYTQGRDATASLGAEMKATGLAGPALVVAGPTVIGLLATVPWAFVDFIRYLVMSDDEFAHRYARVI